MRARSASIFARRSGGNWASCAGVSCITCCIIASGWGAEKPLTGFWGAKAADGPFALRDHPQRAEHVHESRGQRAGRVQ